MNEINKINEVKNNTIICIIGHSGAGKTSIMRKLQQNYHKIEEIVSITSRPKREEEIEGQDYYFLSYEEMQKMRENKELLEYSEHYGNAYGISKKEISRILKNKKIPIVIIDSLGRDILSKYYKILDIEIFLSEKSLKERLIKRGDDVDAIKQRILYDKKTPIYCKYKVEGFRENYQKIIKIIEDSF